MQQPPPVLTSVSVEATPAAVRELLPETSKPPPTLASISVETTLPSAEFLPHTLQPPPTKPATAVLEVLQQASQPSPALALISDVTTPARPECGSRQSRNNSNSKLVQLCM